MRYRALGTSGLKISELCLGTMMFGGPCPEADAQRMAAHAADHGVNFIDTANTYEKGRSEEVVGRAIAARRSHWVLATKLAQPMGTGPNDRGLSRRNMIQATEASLRRLGTDWIDISYIHRVDPSVPWTEVARTFGDLIQSGKIRYWGLSNVRAWHIPVIVGACREAGVPPPVVLQPYYNIMTRMPEVELLPAARACQLGVAIYSPLARGILSGKYQPGSNAPPDTRAGRNDRRMMQTEWRPESLAIAQRLKEHAASKGQSLVGLAVAWALNNQAVTAVIAGPRTFEQWQSYWAALDYPFSKEDEALVDSLVPPGHPSTPGYTDPEYPVEGRFPRLA
ncbi:MAG: aldo/keto reductase [Hyphomicrobiaceae bacterium]|nr:aldo/keto reductase [Hyphomicrobiaceae bacterium]